MINIKNIHKLYHVNDLIFLVKSNETKAYQILG